MSAFAEYIPVRPGSSVQTTPDIAEATVRDLMSVAMLTATREGGTPEEYLESIRAQFADTSHRRLFVACLDNEVVAFARVSWLDVGSIPTGWYLAGVIVSDQYRRCGIGRTLTEYRLRWLASMTDVVYYFANIRNQVTIDLHAAFGFQETQRDIIVPNCTFDDGFGVLYSLHLKSDGM